MVFSPCRPCASVLALALALALAACAFEKEEKPARRAPLKPAYQAEDFVLHLSMAHLALSPKAPDMVYAEHHLDIVEAYTAQPDGPAEKLKVAVLECRDKERKNPQKLMAPLSSKEDDALKELMLMARARECAPSNIHPATVTVKHVPPLSFDRGKPGQVREAVKNQMSLLLSGSARFAPLEETELQLQLTRRFMEYRYQDAAYLALDNAKLSLAAAEKNAGDKEAVAQLLEKLESTEAKLREHLPFKL